MAEDAAGGIAHLQSCLVVAYVFAVACVVSQGVCKGVIAHADPMKIGEEMKGGVRVVVTTAGNVTGKV